MESAVLGGVRTWAKGPMSVPVLHPLTSFACNTRRFYVEVCKYLLSLRLACAVHARSLGGWQEALSQL